MDSLFSILNQTFGITVAVTISVILLMFWLIYYVTKKITIINCSHKELSSDNKKINDKIDVINKDVSYIDALKEKSYSIDKYMDEIRKDIAFIKGSLEISKEQKISNTALFESHSPISLTEQGKKVFEELQQSGILTRNIEHIIKNIDAQELKTAYDIQEYCIKTSSVEPEVFFDEEGINFVKSYAYNNGTSVQLYLRLLGIVIRDEYFKRRNIDVNLVDEH